MFWAVNSGLGLSQGKVQCSAVQCSGVNVVERALHGGEFLIMVHNEVNWAGKAGRRGSPGDTHLLALH